MSDLTPHTETLIGHLLEAFGAVAGIVEHIDSADQEARVKSLCADLDSALRNANALRPSGRTSVFAPRRPCTPTALTMARPNTGAQHDPI